MTSSGIHSEKPAKASESSNPDLLFSTKTPNKTAILPTRSRNTDVSISFPEVKPQGSRDPNSQIKPVKRQILSSPQKPEIAVKLPQRFEILEEFFNGLDTAIRLLKLKGSLTTFANISSKIQYLTNRIFSYDHLAQMKHIYPEAIEVMRVLKYVETTCCMKPSLHVYLNTDAIALDATNCGTKYMELRKVFHSKLVDFYKAHPKDEIPKEPLPEPFNFSKRENSSDTASVALGEPTLEVEEFDVQMEEMGQEEETVGQVIPDSALSSGTEDCLLSSHAQSKIVGTPVKVLSTPSKNLSTPCKDLSTPIRLMIATPASSQPSRTCIPMTPDDCDDSVRSTNDLERCPSRTRCLNFDTLDEDGIVKDESDDEPELVDEGDKNNYEAGDPSVEEDRLLQSMKERPSAEPRKHNLPELVDLIHTLFHSTKQTVITKEELVHKLIASQIDITDRREVEEQLSLMLQLVPDWISETKTSSGDFLVSVNKESASETIRARLEEAVSRGVSTAC